MIQLGSGAYPDSLPIQRTACALLGPWNRTAWGCSSDSKADTCMHARVDGCADAWTFTKARPKERVCLCEQMDERQGLKTTLNALENQLAVDTLARKLGGQPPSNQSSTMLP